MSSDGVAAGMGALGPSGTLEAFRGGMVHRLVRVLALVGFGAMVLLPLIEASARRFTSWSGPSSQDWVQHLTLWIGLFGAVLASWQGRHLNVAVGDALLSVAWKRRLGILTRGATLGILAGLVYASIQLTLAEVGTTGTVGGWLPTSVAIAAMPLGFALMGVVTFWDREDRWTTRGLLVVLALAAMLSATLLPFGEGRALVTVGLAIILMLAAAGMPLYAVLGGAALLLFHAAQVPVAAVPAETYRIVTQPVLPSVPLFALAGVVLARGGAPNRLVRLVRAWFGWIPGGATIATILGCAFFTAITGASGVTILALGGLFLPVLLAARHNESFSLGLLTASGSVGLLFPPSLPVIIYAFYGRIGFNQLFVAAFLPGVLLLLMLGTFSLYVSRERYLERPAFSAREAFGAAGEAWGDLLLPVLVLVGIFGGFGTLVEVAALAAFWAILLETGIHRSLALRAGLGRTLVETAVLIGALIAIIGLAQGVVNYLVDAMIPMRAADWVTGIIESPWVFLIVLNVALLAVGALMDIFSAIVIVVPLLIPIAAAYGIHPAHLGVVFLANLELGYLTPPVGLNLFLSSLTFGRPLLQVWKAALPFLAIFGVWVLLVTYVPWISVGFMELLLQ